MRVFNFSRVIYDGYLTADLFAFMVKQKSSRILVFVDLIPSLIKFLFRRMDATTFMEKVYALILENITVSELNLFKIDNIHKVDLGGFGIVENSKNDIIVTGEPSFLVDLFVNREKYNVICTNYDLKNRKIIGNLCLQRHKINKLHEAGIDEINQLFIYSFKEKNLMKISDYILVYRDHQLIEYDQYEGSLKDKLYYNIVNKNLITFVAVAIFWTLITVVLSGILAIFINPIIAYLIGYLVWIITTFQTISTMNKKSEFSIKKFGEYLVGVIPNLLLQLLFVVIFCGILGVFPWLIYFLGAIVSFPLLIFLIRFYNFD